MRCFEDQYQVLFQNNPLPMWVYDLDSFAFLAVNEAAVRHYGYSQEEFLKMTILDIRPVEEIPRVKAAVQEFKKSGERGFQKSGIWHHCTKDGTLIYVDVSSEAVTYGGKAARLVLLSDVTELKRSTAQVHLLQTCVSRLNDIVLITESEPLDEPGPKIVFVNEAFTRLTGYRPEEALGRSPRFLQGPKTSRAARGSHPARPGSQKIHSRGINRLHQKWGRDMVGNGNCPDHG